MPDLSKVHEALLQQGFTQVVKAPARVIRYAGVLHCAGIDVPVHLDIQDKDFVTLPKITLIKIPSELPLACSHIGDDNTLCYASAKVAHIDFFRAPHQILDCLGKAEAVLSDLLTGNPLADTRDEFSAYWHDERYILVDLPPARKSGTAWTIRFDNGREHWIIGADQPTVEAKYQHAGAVIEKKGASALILDSQIPPIVLSGNWPPKTLGDVASWLNRSDKETLKYLRLSLEKIHRLQLNRILVVVRNQWAWYGFSVGFDRTKRSKHAGAKDWVQHVLFGAGSGTPIIRLAPLQIDQEYVISRNLSASENSLRDKRIILAGCGAIGGYLAELLVRAGAGHGHGRLVLVDPDVLMPGNLGRHILGVKDLFRNKAEALRDWVCASFPSATVVVEKTDARNVSFRGADLLIDATGEEALSNAINRRYLAGGLPPVIYSWIKGPGTATQALLVDSKAQGCYRCLRTAEGKERFSPLLEPVESAVMGHGCDDFFVPFSAAASMQAAALAGNLVLDWVNGHASPRLRTRTISYDNCREVKDKDLTRTAGCPACDG